MNGIKAGDWTPEEDPTVEELFENAIREAYSDASRLDDLSEVYVREGVLQVAKMIIGCCVRLDDRFYDTGFIVGSNLKSECGRLQIALEIVTERVTEDPNYQRDCENHRNQSKRALDFSQC